MRARSVLSSCILALLCALAPLPALAAWIDNDPSAEQSLEGGEYATIECTPATDDCRVEFPDETASDAIAAPGAGLTAIYTVSGEVYRRAGASGTAARLATTVDLANYTTSAILASTANGNGASLIGIEDAGTLITATTVEGALAEIQAAIDAIEINGVAIAGGTADFLDTASIDVIRCTGAGAPDAACTAADDVVVNVLPAGVDHGGLAGLGDDDHPQYMQESVYDSDADGTVEGADTVVGDPGGTPYAAVEVVTGGTGECPSGDGPCVCLAGDQAGRNSFCVTASDLLNMRDRNLDTLPNYASWLCNEVDLTPNPSCADYGVVGSYRLIDIDESATCQPVLCNGTTQIVDFTDVASDTELAQRILAPAASPNVSDAGVWQCESDLSRGVVRCFTGDGVEEIVAIGKKYVVQDDADNSVCAGAGTPFACCTGSGTGTCDDTGGLELAFEQCEADQAADANQKGCLIHVPAGTYTWTKSDWATSQIGVDIQDSGDDDTDNITLACDSGSEFVYNGSVGNTDSPLAIRIEHTKNFRVVGECRFHFTDTCTTTCGPDSGAPASGGGGGYIIGIGEGVENVEIDGAVISVGDVSDSDSRNDWRGIWVTTNNHGWSRNIRIRNTRIDSDTRCFETKVDRGGEGIEVSGPHEDIVFEDSHCSFSRRHAATTGDLPGPAFGFIVREGTRVVNSTCNALGKFDANGQDIRCFHHAHTGSNDSSVANRSTGAAFIGNLAYGLRSNQTGFNISAGANHTLMADNRVEVGSCPQDTEQSCRENEDCLRAGYTEGTATPGTCTVGDTFFDNDDGDAYFCTATDTWTLNNCGDTTTSAFRIDTDGTNDSGGARGNLLIGNVAGTTDVRIIDNDVGGCWVHEPCNDTEDGDNECDTGATDPDEGTDNKWIANTCFLRASDNEDGWGTGDNGDFTTHAAALEWVFTNNSISLNTCEGGTSCVVNRHDFMGPLRLTDGTNTYCLDFDGTAIFHDDDCDGAKGGGEEYVNISGGGLAADSVAFTHIDYSLTLAGNPALLVDECYFAKTATGGCFICEGSTDDTQEQLYCFPDANGADTTQFFVVNGQSLTSVEGAGLVAGGTVLRVASEEASFLTTGAATTLGGVGAAGIDTDPSGVLGDQVVIETADGELVVPHRFAHCIPIEDIDSPATPSAIPLWMNGAYAEATLISATCRCIVGTCTTEATWDLFIDEDNASTETSVGGNDTGADVTCVDSNADMTGVDTISSSNTVHQFDVILGTVDNTPTADDDYILCLNFELPRQ